MVSDSSFGNKPIVSWNKGAYASLQEAYEYIKADSPANAERIREDILAVTRHLPDNPEQYPPDKYKQNNSGDYRAFERHSYRISYRHTAKVVKILRIRHVKQKPKFY